MSAQVPIDQAVPLVRRALKVLSDREVSPQLGLLKSTLLQLDSTFSERTYGVGSFRDFAQKLANAGHVRLREHGRNVLVELADGNGHLRSDDTAHAARSRVPRRNRLTRRRATRPTRASRSRSISIRRRVASRGRPTAFAPYAASSRRRPTRRASRCTCARPSSSCATSIRRSTSASTGSARCRIFSAPVSGRDCSASSATARA